MMEHNDSLAVLEATMSNLVKVKENNQALIRIKEKSIQAEEVSSENASQLVVDEVIHDLLQKQLAVINKNLHFIKMMPITLNIFNESEFLIQMKRLSKIENQFLAMKDEFESMLGNFRLN